MNILGVHVDFGYLHRTRSGRHCPKLVGSRQNLAGVGRIGHIWADPILLIGSNSAKLLMHLSRTRRKLARWRLLFNGIRRISARCCRESATDVGRVWPQFEPMRTSEPRMMSPGITPTRRDVETHETLLCRIIGAPGSNLRCHFRSVTTRRSIFGVSSWESCSTIS